MGRTLISSKYAKISHVTQSMLFSNSETEMKGRKRETKRQAFLATQEHQKIFTWIAPKQKSLLVQMAGKYTTCQTQQSNNSGHRMFYSWRKHKRDVFFDYSEPQWCSTGRIKFIWPRRHWSTPYELPSSTPPHATTARVPQKGELTLRGILGSELFKDTA